MNRSDAAAALDRVLATAAEGMSQGGPRLAVFPSIEYESLLEYLGREAEHCGVRVRVARVVPPSKYRCTCDGTEHEATTIPEVHVERIFDG